MHELSITQNIVDIVVEHATRAKAERVTAIHLVIGNLTGFVDESIQFCFDMLSPGTIAAGARVGIQRVPARVRCRACAQEFEPEGLNWACPQCTAVGGEVLRGRELQVDSIEIQ